MEGHLGGAGLQGTLHWVSIASNIDGEGQNLVPAVVGPSRLKESKTDVLPQLLEEVLSDSCPSGACPK